MIGHNEPLLSESVPANKRRVPWRSGVALLAVASAAATAGYFFHQPQPTAPITPTPTPAASPKATPKATPKVSPKASPKANGLLSCGTKEQCLTIIDNYFLRAKRQTFHKNGAGLVQTYGPNSIGGGPCGANGCELVEPCPNFAVTPHCRFDVYDNALTAIYLTKRGKLSEARKVLDAFITLLYPTGNVTAGLDYGAGTLLPSHRSLTLLAAGYTDKAAYAGWYEGVGVADGAVDTGNNAWVGMAFAHYSAATGDDCYSTVAHDLLAALSKAMPCPDELQGFGSRLAPYPANYRSTEHNTDMFALSHMLGAAGAAVETRASAFVHGMWARHVGDEGKDPTYSTGTGNAMACDATVPPGPAAVDAQFWNLLAGADTMPKRKEASIRSSVLEPKGLWFSDTDLIGNLTSGVGKGAELQGVRFSTGGHGIQWENTGSAVMAMTQYRRWDKPVEAGGLPLSDKINAARDSLKHLLAVYGVVPASVLGGNYQTFVNISAERAGYGGFDIADLPPINVTEHPYPGGSHTGIGWTYLRYPHAASTAWAGLLLMFQFQDSDYEVDANANPFAPPKGVIPDPSGSKTSKHLTCLPASSVPWPVTTTGSGAACAANPGCAGLAGGTGGLIGDCCPTTEGMMLGCCSDLHAPPAPPPEAPAPPPDKHSKAGAAGEHKIVGGESCAANSDCVTLGLTGVCCPTEDGSLLGCCNNA